MLLISILFSLQIEKGDKSWHVIFVFQFKQDGTEMDKVVKWGEEYSYIFPLWFGPFVSIINIQHPDYSKTILTSSGVKNVLHLYHGDAHL